MLICNLKLNSRNSSVHQRTAHLSVAGTRLDSDPAAPWKPHVFVSVPASLTHSHSHLRFVLQSVRPFARPFVRSVLSTMFEQGWYPEISSTCVSVSMCGFVQMLTFVGEDRYGRWLVTKSFCCPSGNCKKVLRSPNFANVDIVQLWTGWRRIGKNGMGESCRSVGRYLAKEDGTVEGNNVVNKRGWDDGYCNVDMLCWSNINICMNTCVGEGEFLSILRSATVAIKIKWFVFVCLRIHFRFFRYSPLVHRTFTSYSQLVLGRKLIPLTLMEITYLF